MALMNHSSAGVRTVFLPCRPDLGFVSSRFIREIAARTAAGSTTWCLRRSQRP